MEQVKCKFRQDRQDSFWRRFLSSPFRRPQTHSEHPFQLPISIDLEASLAANANPDESSNTLVRSNACAKSLRHLQVIKTDRSSGRHPNLRTNDCVASMKASSCKTTDVTAVGHEAKLVPPLPPPYVLRLPEAVLTAQSLSTLTNNELRLREVYSPHPMPEPPKLRSTSFRSTLSMLVPSTENASLLARSVEPPRQESCKVGHMGRLPPGLLFLSVCGSVLMISLDRGTITTSLPSILAEFKSFPDMSWHVSAYLLTASALQPMYGRIYSSSDVKWTFCHALGTFKAGALVCALAPNSRIFILGRAIQGVDSAGLSSGSHVFVIHNFSIEKRSVLLSTLSIVHWTGAVAGPVLGGVFTQLGNWRWCSYLNLILAGLILACVLPFYRSSQSQSPRPSLVRQASDFSTTGRTFARQLLALDWVGNLLFLSACKSLFLALQISQYPDPVWWSPRCIILTCLSAATMLIFALWMYVRCDNALMPSYILRRRTVAVSCGVSFFLYGAYTIQIYFLPIWFQAIQDRSTIDSGVGVGPFMLAMALLSIVVIYHKYRGCYLSLSAMFGCGLATCGAGLMTILRAETSMTVCAGLQVLMAIGLGVGLQQSLATVEAILPLHEVPMGMAIVIACQNAGGAVFVSVASTVFQNGLLQADHIPGVDLRATIRLGMTRLLHLVPPEAYPDVSTLYESAFESVFYAMIPLCGIGFLLSLCVEWRSTCDDGDDEIHHHSNVESLNRGFDTPELGSDAPTLAHLAPRARQRWSQKWKRPTIDTNMGRVRLSTILHELKLSEASLSPLDEETDAEIKEIEIGMAIST